MPRFDKPGEPKASELRELLPEVRAGNREAFVRAMKVGLYLHARKELGLAKAEAIALLGEIPWDKVTLKVVVEEGGASA